MSALRVGTSRLKPLVLALTFALAVTGAARAAFAQESARISDLTTRPGEVPRRLVGYGLVVGLDGTGDRSWGTQSGSAFTVRSVVNLLRRFNVQVPEEQLRLRNVAAVLVTAEVSPFLRAGGRFEVSIGALGDATSLRGGQLWITPLVSDPDHPPVATAQGAIYVTDDGSSRNAWARRTNSGRIAQGGVLEVDPPTVAMAATRLVLRSPDLGTASRIAAAVNTAFGPGTAKVEDPGAIALTPGARSSDASAFLAAVDTLSVVAHTSPRIVIDGREGTVVAGGEVRVGNAVVSHAGITLQIGGTPGPSAKAAPSANGTVVGGLVHMEPRASVQDVAAGLHAMGARPEEIAAIFESLQAAGALHAEVVIR